MKTISCRVKKYSELPKLSVYDGGGFLNDTYQFHSFVESLKFDSCYSVCADWREESEKSRKLTRLIWIYCNPSKNEFEIKARPKGKLTETHIKIISILSALCLEVGVQNG